MSHYCNNNPENQIQQYSGAPNKPASENDSKWRKFIKILLPWIARKWDLGNAFLEAKVAKEVNEAAKIEAETVLLKIEAEKQIREIVNIAQKEDENASIELNESTPLTAEEVETAVKELVEKIRYLYLIRGMRISITFEEPENVRHIEPTGGGVQRESGNTE